MQASRYRKQNMGTTNNWMRRKSRGEREGWKVNWNQSIVYWRRYSDQGLLEPWKIWLSITIQRN